MPIYKHPVNAHISNLFQVKSVEALAPNCRVFVTNSHQTKHQGNVYKTTTQLQASPSLVNTKLNLFANTSSKSKMVVRHFILRNGYRYINAKGKDIAFSTWQNNQALIQTENIHACCVSSF